MNNSGKTQGIERSVDDLAVAEVDVSDLLPTVLERFESQGLRYVVQRNYEHFPIRAYRRDIGLLVDHREVRRMITLSRTACEARGYFFSLGRPGSNSVIMYAERPAATQDGEQAQFERLKFDARTYEPFPRPGRELGRLSYRVLLDQVSRRRVEQHGCVFHVPGQPDEMILLFKQWRRKGLTRHRLQLVEMLRGERTRRWFREATGVDDATIDAVLARSYGTEHDDLLWKMATHRWGHSLGRTIDNTARTIWARLHFPRVQGKGGDHYGVPRTGAHAQVSGRDLARVRDD